MLARGALIMLSEKQEHRKHCQSREQDRHDDFLEVLAAAPIEVVLPSELHRNRRGRA